MAAQEKDIQKDYLGIIFGSSITDEQINIIKNSSLSKDEKKHYLSDKLSDKQKFILSEFINLNYSNITDFSFLNFSILDEHDFKNIIEIVR